MTVKQLETEILALTKAEKLEVIQILTQNFLQSSRGVSKTPGVVGGDACIAKTRIPVWSLVNYRRIGASDAQILEAFPHLSAADLVNAWAYAEAYPEEIEQAIRENDEVMQESDVV
ncbi:MAG: DUF433 domain-containing protein [Symploca sp. SIO2E6]|nr:DUF433 domain-containing protein [Symploca sp. SIO2E6]